MTTWRGQWSRLRRPTDKGWICDGIGFGSGKPARRHDAADANPPRRRCQSVCHRIKYERGFWKIASDPKPTCALRGPTGGVARTVMPVTNGG